MQTCALMPLEYREAYMAKRNNLEEMPAISQWLFIARRRAGKSQDQVAEAADIDTTYVSKIELGHKTPSKKVIMKLSEALTESGGDERTARALLNAGLRAAGFASDDNEITYDLDPDALSLAEGYSGLPGFARRIVDNAYKSASELALEMDRENSIGKRAE